MKRKQHKTKQPTKQTKKQPKKQTNSKQSFSKVLEERKNQQQKQNIYHINIKNTLAVRESPSAWAHGRRLGVWLAIEVTMGKSKLRKKSWKLPRTPEKSLENPRIRRDP